MSAFSPLNRLLASCGIAEQYPKNLVHCNTYPHVLDDYALDLEQRDADLFSPEREAALDLWEYDVVSRAFQETRVSNLPEMKQSLPISRASLLPDSPCTIYSIHAINSRENLKITRKMLTYVLTYYQVMPYFLEFLSQFGRQLYPRDLHFSGFRCEIRLAEPEKGPAILELGRSGREVQMCYNLKSVEIKDASSSNPVTSVRAVAIYHSFDVDLGNATWIVVKGNELFKQRLAAATQSLLRANADAFANVPNSFSVTLAVHLVVADWSGEKWKWYINLLENQFQDLTRRAVAVEVTRHASLPRPPENENAVGQWRGQTSIQPQRFTLGRGFRRAIRQAPAQAFNMIAMHAGSAQGPRPIDEPEDPPDMPPDLTSEGEEREISKGSPDFTFGDLQETQSLEEKANEMLLILKTNATTLLELSAQYEDLGNAQDVPDELKEQCMSDLTRFRKRIGSIVGELRMHQSRTEMLLRLIGDRRTLLYGILQYRSMEASMMFAQKAQLSAYNMEDMTRNMQDLTRKTKQETVSMRIITLVTLAFLPGTFISTLMSTDIVHFQANKKMVSYAALWLYMEVSLPLTVGTFAAWWVMSWYIDRKQERSTSKRA